MPRIFWERLSQVAYFLCLLFLPFQFGKHFWPPYTQVSGIRIDYLSPTIYPTDIFILLLFLFSFKDYFRNFSFKKQQLFFYLIPFLIIGIVQSRVPQAGIYGLIKFFEIAFFGWYTAIFSNRHRQAIANIFSLTIIVEALLAIVQFLLQRSIGGLFYFLGERTFSAQTPGIANARINGGLLLRAYATFPHPNVFAGFLVLSMIYILLVLKKTTNLAMLSLLLGTVALFLTLSRVAILFWVGFLLLVVFRKTGKKAIKWAAITCALVVILFSPLRFRFFDNSFFSDALLPRKELLGYSLEMIKAYPLFGVGINNFYAVLASLQKPTVENLSYYLQPVHNIFLLVASESGIIVGVLFFGTFVYKIASLAKSAFTYPVFFMLLFIFLVGFSDHYFLTLQQGQLLLAFVFGLSFAKQN